MNDNPSLGDAIPTGGFAMILAERQRQKEETALTDEGVDKLPHGIMLASATLLEVAGQDDPQMLMDALSQWPPEYGLSWFKPSKIAQNNLVHAGALYAAEAERLERAGLSNEMTKEGLHRCVARIDEMLETPDVPRIIVP